MNNGKKQPFILNVFRSITDFEYYKKISSEMISKSFIYFFVLICIYSIATTIGMVYSIQKSINETRKFVDREINSFSYTEGKLAINNDEYKSFFNNYIIIDTSKENNDEHESNARVIIGKQYCSIKLEDNVFKFKYNDYFYEDINKEDIMQFLSNDNMIQYYIIFSILIFITVAIILSFSTLIDILIIALIGNIISKIIGNHELKFLDILKLSIHAITLPIILAMIYYLINAFTGFYIKYFSIMYTSIATIYVMTAILLITMDSYKKNNIDIK